MDRKYSVILGNLGNTCDRFCNGYKTNPPTMKMLKQAAGIPAVKGIELVGTWDIRPDNAVEMKRALNDFGLTCVSIIPDLFADKTYWKGSFSSKEAKVRRKAIDYTRQMCDIAGALGCKLINLWPGQDGYDYLLTADYEREREWECAAVHQLAKEYRGLKFALEYKPKEPRTHSYLARMADTLCSPRRAAVPMSACALIQATLLLPARLLLNQSFLRNALVIFFSTCISTTTLHRGMTI